MKSKLFKFNGLALSLIAGLLLSPMAYAKVLDGQLGVAIMATDIWTFSCTRLAKKARIRLVDPKTITNPTMVRAFFNNFRFPGKIYTAPANEGSPSPWATNATNPIGSHKLLIRKTGAKLEDYQVQAECLNSAGQSIGPSLFTLIQNQ